MRFWGFRQQISKAKYLKISQNVDRKYLEASGEHRGTVQKNISKCRLDISGASGEHRGTVQNDCETLQVSAIKGSGYVWPGKLKRSPLPSGVRIPDVKHPGGMSAAAEFRMWDIRVEWRRSKIPDVIHPGGMSTATRSAVLRWCVRTPCPDDSISYLDMLSGWKRPTFRRPPMVCPDIFCKEDLSRTQSRIPKNSPQSWIALVIKKLSKHQNLTQFD